MIFARIAKYGLAGLTALAACAVFPSPASAASTEPVRPLSASGCTGNTVCIFVQGSGLTVNTVGGGVTVPGGAASYRTWCGYIGVTVRNGGTTYVADISPYGCANPFSPYQWTDTLNRSFPNNSRACLYAYTDSGRYNPGGPACETIHK